MFHQGDLQSGIALAVEQAKMVLCFVKDQSSTSEHWEGVLSDLSEAITTETVAFRLDAGSQEAGFLSSFCPIEHVPTTVLIKGGVVKLHLWNGGPASVTTEQLKVQLEGALRKNDSSHMSEPTSPSSTTVSNVNPTAQVPTTNTTPAVPSVAATPTVPSAPANSEARPSPRTNAMSSKPTAQTTPPISTATQAQQSQRANYVKMQKEREQKQRDERERIKQQIKNDREERRRREELRKQPQQAVDGTGSPSGPYGKPKSRDIRVQVRTFDGSTLRQSFAPSANITSDIRPWVDSAESQPIPYNLKLILTPLPNRDIEAAEEEQSLVDLGVQGSCTLIMVPVKGYVESYTGSTAGGLIGFAVSGGYNVVTGTAGAVFGAARSFLGWNNNQERNTDPASRSIGGGTQQDPEQPTPNARVRTLADQRMELAKKKDQQFYNGNQLNFEPRKDEGKDD